MRILIVSDCSSYMRGGVPTETRNLIRGLIQRDHEVALASDAPLPGVAGVSHFPITRPVGNRLCAEVGVALERFKPTFVHVICMNSKGVMLLAPILDRSRWALTVHSVPPYERKLTLWHANEHLHYGGRALRFLANALVWQWVFRSGRVPKIIAHSQYVADIITRYGGKRDRLLTIFLPFEAKEVAGMKSARSCNVDAPSLLTVGGLAHTKGQHDVVKALPTLAAKHPGIRYQMIGEVRGDDYLQHLLALARDLGVAERLSFASNLSGEELQSALLSTDVYVQPSHEEGFCLAYAEAAAVVPRLVGTRSGAIPAMSDGDPGARVVPVRQPNAIAEAVSELLQLRLSDSLFDDRRARLLKSFSFKNYIDAHERLYAG